MLNSISITKSKATWIVFFSFMFALFLDSMYAYFFWSIPFITPGIVAVFSCIFVVNNLNYFSFSKKNVIPFLFFFITLLYTKRDQNINGYIGGILPFVGVFFVFLLKNKYKARFLETLTKTLSVILGVSLLVWILVQLGVQMPKTTISYLGDGTVFTLNNYYVFIEYPDMFDYHRFMSIFIEPGYLGTLLAILIYINNFEFKRKEVLIIFLSFIFTFSIAGYLMLAVGYVSFVLKNKNHAIRYLFFSLFILTISYNLLFQINDGKVLNALVISRLEIDNEKGLSGYNRTDDEMDNMFIQFLGSKDVLTGIGERYKHFGSNVGYKPYIIINGLIGLLLLLFSYLSGWYFNKRLFSLTIFIFFIMIFSKGHSEIFWAGYLMIYGTSMFLPQNWREVYVKEKYLKNSYYRKLN